MLNDLSHKRFGKKKESRKEENKKNSEVKKKKKKKANYRRHPDSNLRPLCFLCFKNIALYHCTTQIRYAKACSILIIKPSLCKLVVYYLFFFAITFE